MTREEIMQLNTDYLNGCESEHEMNELFYYVLELQKHELKQEPKTCRWIDDRCSVCGKGTEDLIDSREWYRNEEPNFCPFCGLKLVDLQEDKEKEG